MRSKHPTRRAIGLPRRGTASADRKVSRARTTLPIAHGRFRYGRTAGFCGSAELLLALFVHLYSRCFDAVSSQPCSKHSCPVHPSASMTTASARKPNGLIVPCLRTNVPESDRHLSSTMLTAGHNVRDKARLPANYLLRSRLWPSLTQPQLPWN